eukprot:TRINITY_DN26066_c0_g1_i2.p1 TRINITY_DN26066_c0_g1~~TRINITY_DN26066_c0_g1_i2.p1  ORF type:complete len:1551 (-),score=327.91 TRINITY_DN26066_c0_g1_i2:37-4689(-)
MLPAEQDPTLPPLENILEEPQQEPQTEEDRQQQLLSLHRTRGQLPAPPGERARPVVPFLDQDSADEEQRGEGSEADSENTLPVKGLSRVSRDSEGLLSNLPSRARYDDDEESAWSREQLPANLLDLLMDDESDDEVSKGATSRDAGEDGSRPLWNVSLAAQAAPPLASPESAESAGRTSQAWPSTIGASTEKSGPPLGRRLPDPPLEQNSAGGKGMWHAFGPGKLNPSLFPTSPTSMPSPSRSASNVSIHSKTSVPSYSVEEDDEEDDVRSDGKSVRSRASVSDDLGKSSKHTCCCLRCCSCDLSRVVLPACSIFLVLALALPMVVAPLWMESLSVVTVGAFGYLKQVPVLGSIDEAYLKGALAKAVDLASVNLFSIEGGDGGRNLAIDDASSVWHSIELFWTMQPSRADLEKDVWPHVVSDAYMVAVRDAEASLKALSSWPVLCNMSKPEVRHLCTLGDSLANVVYSTWKDPSQDEINLGVEFKVSFDGDGRRLSLPVESVLTLIGETSSGSLDRWLPRGGPAAEETRASRRTLLRSIFSFQLNASKSQQWESFVEQELKPVLRNMQAEAQAAEASARLMVYCKVDGDDLESLSDVFDAATLGILLSLAAALSTILLTRRALLSLATGLLVAFSSAVGTFLASDEVSPTSAMAWSATAITCTELAVACSSLFLRSRTWRRPLSYAAELGRMQWTCIWELLTAPLWRANKVTVNKVLHPLHILVQAFGPLLGYTGLLFMISSQLDHIPMVNEYARPAAMGSLCVLAIGPVMLVPAVLVGDLLAEKHLLDLGDGCMSYLVPKEFGSYPLTKMQQKHRRQLAMMFVSAFERRLVAFLLLVALLVAGIYVAGRGGISFDANTPELFPEQHVHRTSREVKAQFSGMPSPGVVANTSRQSANVCTNTAQASTECAWYSCKADNVSAQLDPGWCYCDARLSFDSCTPSARFAGFDEMPEEFLAQEFWPWVKERVSGVFFNTSGEPLLQVEAPLAVEDWYSGKSILHRQVTSVLNASNPGACFQAYCYCGGTRCQQPGGDWGTLGGIYYYGAGRRRQARRGQEAQPVQEVRRVQEAEVLEVIMAWGLERKNSVKSTETLRFPQPLRLADPQVQRDLLASCEGTPPDLAVVSRRCFALDFKIWLEGRGDRFPVAEESFRTRLEEFLQQQRPGDSKKYFWLSSDGGTLVGTFATFVVQMPTSSAERRDAYDRWQYYSSLRKRWNSAGVGWIATPGMTFQDDEAEILEDAATTATRLCLAVVALTMLVCTCSCWSALTACATIGSCLLVLLMIASASGITEKVGILQLLGYNVFLSTSVPSLLRVLLLYSGASSGPMRRPRLQGSVSSKPLEEPQSEPATRNRQVFTGSSYQSVYGEAELAEELAKEAEEERLNQAASERKEILSYFRRSTMRYERRHRVMAVLCRAWEMFLGQSICGLMSWLILLTAAPQAVGEVAASLLAMALSMPISGLCVLPILLLGGLGPVRVWAEALLTFAGAMTGLNRRLGGPACKNAKLRTPEDDVLEVRLTSKVLGFPFSLLGRVWADRKEHEASLVVGHE